MDGIEGFDGDGFDGFLPLSLTRWHVSEGTRQVVGDGARLCLVPARFESGAVGPEADGKGSVRGTARCCGLSGRFGPLFGGRRVLRLRRLLFVPPVKSAFVLAANDTRIQLKALLLGGLLGSPLLVLVFLF